MTIFLPPRGLIPLALLAAMPLFNGCHSIGPGTVARDRFDYSRSISDSWKQQLMLNIVKLRYMDPPVSMEVGQIVAGYSLETDLSVGGGVASDGINSLSMGAGGKYTDRPTITYTPLTGNRFIRSAMMPLPPSSVFFLIQSGWPADGVLTFSLASINGLKNQEASVSGVTPPSPDFLRFLELLRKVQLSGAVALRIEEDVQKHETVLLAFHTKGITSETLKDLAELKRLLQLSPDAREFRLVFGATQANDKELAVVTRSLLHIMGNMSAFVDIPAEHIQEGRATPGLASPGALRIHCTKGKPKDAFAAATYRNLWFWIDDRDLKTKRAFGLLMILQTLGDTGQHESLPLITIPAQ